MPRVKRADAGSHPLRAQLLAILRTRGALTQSQLAKLMGVAWGRLQWHLYVLEREGKVRRVSKDGTTYYAPTHAELPEAI
ncbi:MAG: transcriptional regulator [Thermoproteus sp.]